MMHDVSSSQATGDLRNPDVPDGLWRLEDSLLANKYLLLSGARVICHAMCADAVSREKQHVLTSPSLFFQEVTCAPCRYTSAVLPCKACTGVLASSKSSKHRLAAGDTHVRASDLYFLQAVGTVSHSTSRRIARHRAQRQLADERKQWRA